MSPEEIGKLQLRVGATPDRFWGPKSIAACQAHLRAMMPSTSPWPASDTESLRAFYGKPGDESNLVTIEFPFPVFYDGRPVKGTRVHRKCAASLLRVLEK